MAVLVRQAKAPQIERFWFMWGRIHNLQSTIQNKRLQISSYLFKMLVLNSFFERADK
jgi:hypothetical protein